MVVGKKDKMKLREEPKFRSVHTKSTFDSTFGGWYSEHVPLTTKFMQSILGKERVSVFHVGSADLPKDILGVGRIVGKVEHYLHLPK